MCPVTMFIKCFIIYFTSCFQRPERTASLPILHGSGGRFRHGVLQLMIHTIDPLAESKNQEKLTFKNHENFTVKNYDNTTKNHKESRQLYLIVKNRDNLTAKNHDIIDVKTHDNY